MASTSNILNFLLPDAGEFPGTWGDPVNNNFLVIDSLFNSQSGHAHNGSPGQGARILHSNLSGSGTKSHALIDAHIDNTGIHQDTRISLVQSANETQAFTNVTDLRFANATLEEVSSGVVLITPQGGGSGTGGTGGGATSAPVVYYDIFTAEERRPIAEQGYTVLKNQVNAPQFLTSGNLGTPKVGAELIVTSVDIRDGYCSNLIDCVTPHGIIQRVGVAIEEVQLGDVTSADQYGFYLNLLSSDRDVPSLSTSFPVELGLSWSMRVVNIAGTEKLVNSIIIKSSTSSPAVIYRSPFPAPANWAHPDGGAEWNLLPVDYLKGCHEFSLSVPTPGSYTLSYYYNSGLVFSKTFTSEDGVFFNSIEELINNLKVVNSPRLPEFGRMGFSCTYSLQSGSSLGIKVGSVMAASVGESISTSITTVPAPTTPTAVPVCGGEPPWDNLFVGNFFDPDAGGPIAPNLWVIQGPVPAAGGNGEGFSIASGSQTQTIYCESPVPAPQQFECVVSNATVPIAFPGINIPPPPFLEFEFLAGSPNIPTDWANGDNGTYFSVGDPLPAEFVQAGMVTSTVNSGGTTSLSVPVSGGTRLPWGAAITLQISPKYTSDPAYSIAFTNSMGVCGARPQVTQAVTYRFDVPTGIWQPIGPGQTPFECDNIAIFISGINLPLGPNYWADGTQINEGYGIADTGIEGGGPTFAVNTSSATPLDVRFSRFYVGALDTSAPVLGAPPRAPQTSQTPIGVNFSRGGVGQETMMILGQLGQNAWNGGDARDITVSLRDNTTSNEFETLTVLQGSSLRPKPLIGTPGGAGAVPAPPLSSTVGGSTVTVTYVLENPDPDVVITPTTGFASPPPPLSRDDDAVTVTSPTPDTEQWVISGLTLAASGPVALEAENVAAERAYPGTSKVTIPLGTVGVEPSLTPTAVYVSGFILEDTTQEVVIRVDESTVEPGTRVGPEAGLTDIVQIQSIDRTSRPLVGNEREWVLTVTTVDVPGGQSISSTMTELVILNPGSGNSSIIPGIPLRETPTPDITRIDLDSQNSGVSQWVVTEQGSRQAFITIRNAGLSTIAELSASTSGEGTAQLNDFRLLSGDIYQADLFVNNLAIGDTVDLFVSVATSGDPLTDTLSPAITITPGIAIENLNTGFTTLAEGSFGTFNFTGLFPTAGDVTIRLEDDEGNSITHPAAPAVEVTTQTATNLRGSFRINDSLAGTPVSVRVTLDDEGYTQVFPTELVVSSAPTPSISNVDITSTEPGAIGATLTITGSNLNPSAPPTPFSQVNHVFVFTDTYGPGDALLNVTPVSFSPNSLVFTVDINAAAEGASIGLDIAYLGGDTASFTGLITLGTTVGVELEPQISSIFIGETGDAGGDEDGGNLLQLGTNTLTLEGINLGTNIVGTASGSPVELQVVGLDNATNGKRETESPPGEGLHNDFALGAPLPTTLVSQTKSRIVVTVNVSSLLIDTNLKIQLKRPASHSDGAGTWLDSEIDQITPTDTDHKGLTIAGPVGTGLKLNGDPGIGLTRYDTAQALLAATGPGSEGSTFNLTIRLDRALEKPPVIITVPDKTYGIQFTKVSVLGTSSPFEWVIKATVPEPSQTPAYGQASFTVAKPVTTGFQLQSGVPIASATLGASAWSTQVPQS